MAALTLSQIEAQVRALLSDAGAGSLEFTPEQMGRAIDFAQVQAAKHLGVTYHEFPIEVINRKVAIPLDAISVIRLEISEEVVQYPSYGALAIRIGADPNYETFTFDGNYVEAHIYPSTPSFWIVDVSFRSCFSVDYPEVINYRLVMTNEYDIQVLPDVLVGGMDGNVTYNDPHPGGNSVTIQFPEHVFDERWVGSSVLNVYVSSDGIGEELTARFRFLGKVPT